MVGGDFGMEDVFSQSELTGSEGLGVPYFIWIIFVIIMPILLSNMLVRFMLMNPYKCGFFQRISILALFFLMRLYNF